MLNVLCWSAVCVVIVWLDETITEAEGEVWFNPPPPCNLLLTVPRQYFCCGSSVLHVMSVCIWCFLFCSVL